MNEELEQSAEPLREFSEQLLAYAPRFALFLAVIVAGLLLSWIARGLTRWIVKRSGLETLAERLGVAKLLYAVGVRDGAAQALATLVWIGGLLLTFAAAAELLGLTAVASGVALVMAFLPRLLAAAVVLLLGISAATLVRKVVARVAKGSRLESPEVVAAGLYYVVITISVVMAADQAGLETTLVHQLVVVAVTITLAAVGLAFALGSRGVFRNLIAAHYLRRALHPGDGVRVGEAEGVLVRYAGVSAVLRTEAGELLVPCQVLLDQVIDVRPVTGRRADPQAAAAARTSPTPPP